MALKWVLFDLDGTLLPMDQDEFVKSYFGTIAAKMAPFGYNPDELIKGIWKGTGVMIKNDGSKSNEQAFWDCFSAMFGCDTESEIPRFESYYQTEFDKVKDVCGFNEKARETVDAIAKMGYKLALATNPIFPSIATEKRIKWAGLEKTQFEHFTTYENSSFCKPSLEYYLEIMEKLGCEPKECLMVGNDVTEDMIADKLGMKVFLLTDCLINKNNADISAYPNGSFDDLLKYIKKLRSRRRRFLILK